MGRGRLTEEEKASLLENVYVVDVVDNRIIYSNDFKHIFIEEYNSGKKPKRIFIDAGFDPQVLGLKRIERASARWRESYKAGTLGKYEDGSVRHKEAEQRKAQGTEKKKGKETTKTKSCSSI